MRLLKYLLIIPILSYGSVKAYMWYEINDKLESLVRTTAPFVDITYGSIYTSIDGSAGIKNIVIRPISNSDKFSIDDISITSTNLFSLVAVVNSLNKGKIPESINNASLKGVAIDLGGETFTQLAALQKTIPGRSTNPVWLEQINALGCGNVSQFGASEYIRMGHSKLLLNIDLDSQYSVFSNRLNMGLRLNDSDLYNIELSVEMKIDDLNASNFSISKAQLNYSDTGYFELRNQFCAAQNKSNIDDYIDHHIQLVNQEFNSPPSENTIKAYHKFLKQGGEIFIEVKPEQLTNINELKFHKVEDIIDILALQISINETPIDVAQLNWKGQVNVAKANSIKKGNPSPVARKKTTLTGKKLSRSDKKANLRAKIYQPQFRSVMPKKLARFIGRPVKITTSVGKLREGYIERIDENNIQLIEHFSSGEFSYPVKISEITSAKVYF